MVQFASYASHGLQNPRLIYSISYKWPYCKYTVYSLYLSCISVHAYASTQCYFHFQQVTVCASKNTAYICLWVFLSLSQPPAVYSNQQYQLNNNWVTVMYLLRDHNSLIRSEQFLETEEFFVSFAKLPHSKKCWVRGGLQTVDYSNQKMT